MQAIGTSHHWVMTLFAFFNSKSKTKIDFKSVFQNLNFKIDFKSGFEIWPDLKMIWKAVLKSDQFWKWFEKRFWQLTDFKIDFKINLKIDK